VIVSGALLGTDQVVFADASGGALSLSLPDPGPFNGATLTVKKIDATVNTVTVTPFAAETIDGGASFVITSPQEAVDFYSDGVDWYTL
jgi:hypothetical protein